jgi:hypothetical protein
MHRHRNSCVPRPVVLIVLFVVTLLLSSCGNNNTNTYASSNTSVSSWQHRIFVTNAFVGTTLIFNATNDLVYGRAISTISGNDLLTESLNGAFTLEFSSGPNVVYLIDNSLENISGNPISLPGDVETMAVLSGNATAVTASRNAPVNGQPNGAVLVLDLTNRVISQTISVPLARRIAVNHAGTKVLAFSDNSNTAYVIDTSAGTATAIADPGAVLDRPVTAVFSKDDNTAYIFSCGSECGGAQARVTTFNPSTNALGNSVDVTGATTGIVDDSGKLYVAGSTGGAGTLQTIDTAGLSSGTATASAPVGITDGYHKYMAFSDGNRLYIGASNCTNIKDAQGNDVQGCLSIYNVSGGSVVKAAATGDVTGIQPIIGRNLVYVTQGGELVIYDVNADAPRSTGQVDIVGNAAAVLQIS